ncbi:MAG TPA: response regulator [Leptospiraceae bacterium]|nr:response regulator [Leptospiraceae bacterium]HMW06614.1 response regulator [Leptospiraceae bacterium]HMX32042.1 response regulator [Leptospiraceae bacterium]HMY31195.1 response regulator [Leptospiraceae bacterium]HMZ63318.1 response regulator [Leptospiraceae bacterium]
MIKEKVLVTDDDISIRTLLINYLTKLNYEVHSAEDGNDALSKIQTQQPPFNLLITDLDMPGMGGKSLIQQVKDLYPDLIIMVVSSHDESKIIIDIMRMGVFDYIVKPINREELQLKATRAMSAALLKKDNLIYEKEKTLRLENQINWFNYKEQSKSNELFSQEKLKQNLFTNLKTHLGQGMGFGLLTSVSEMILMCPKDEKGNYLISPDIVEILEINANYARNVISYFGGIEKIFDDGILLQKLPISTVYQLTEQIVKKQANNADSSHLKIILSEGNFSDNVFIRTNSSYYDEVISELLINAIKYSEQYSQISILFSLESDKLKITVLNKPLKYGKKEAEGIKEEYLNLIFEPFFRIEKAITNESMSLNYGLGLTKVKIILERMDATIQVSNFNDYSGKSPSIKVGFTISFPIVS